MPKYRPQGHPTDGGGAVSLSVRGLSIRPTGRPALEDIALSLPRGERLALLGPPGAGQVELLLAIVGLLKPAQGTLLTDGRDITKLRAAKRGIGLMLLTPPPGRFPALRMRRLAPRPSHGLLLLDRPDAWPLSDVTVIAAFADQALALSGADRIAILRDGRLVQEGPSAAVYETPRTRFVATFLGGANIVAGTVREVWPGRFVMATDGQRLHIAAAPDAPRAALGTPLTLALRPERIALLHDDEAADNIAAGTVVTAMFQGASVLLGVETKLGRIDVRLPGWRAAQAPAQGAPVRLGWSADAAVPVQED